MIDGGQHRASVGREHAILRNRDFGCPAYFDRDRGVAVLRRSRDGSWAECPRSQPLAAAAPTPSGLFTSLFVLVPGIMHKKAMLLKMASVAGGTPFAWLPSIATINAWIAT
jgi:hypothetical protein